jgi:hypothetical protein
MEANQRRRLLDAGRDCFNRGEFYEAHEHWEDLWNEIDDPDRRWVQGLIQIATGLHKLKSYRSDVCATLFTKALAKLHDAPETFELFALGKLRRDAAEALKAIERGERPDPASFQLALG